MDAQRGGNSAAKCVRASENAAGFAASVPAAITQRSATSGGSEVCARAFASTAVMRAIPVSFGCERYKTVKLTKYISKSGRGQKARGEGERGRKRARTGVEKGARKGRECEEGEDARRRRARRRGTRKSKEGSRDTRRGIAGWKKRESEKRGVRRG